MLENQMQEKEQCNEKTITAYQIDVEKFNNRSSDPEEGWLAMEYQENIVCEIGRNKNFITKLITNSNGSYIVSESRTDCHKNVIKMKLNSSEMISKFMGISVDKKFVKIITLIDNKKNDPNRIKIYVKINDGDKKGYIILQGSSRLINTYCAMLNNEDWVYPHQIDFYVEEI